MNDRLLALLVHSVEQHDDPEAVPLANSAITLNVGGILISGFITSAVAFLKSKESVLGPIIESISTQEGVALNERPPIEFIHLRDARFFIPGGNHSVPTSGVPGVYWRGKIENVDGFFLGTINMTVTRN